MSVTFESIKESIKERRFSVNYRPPGMSGVDVQSAVNRDQGIYLDFSSNTEANEEKPVSSDEGGQVNKSFGKMAPCLLNLLQLFYDSRKNDLTF